MAFLLFLALSILARLSLAALETLTTVLLILRPTLDLRRPSVSEDTRCQVKRGHFVVIFRSFQFSNQVLQNKNNLTQK